MSQSPIDRPYVHAWLKRVGRELSGSGRVSQISMALAEKHGGRLEDWSHQLRDIICGRLQPGPELIADIDQILARPSPQKRQTEFQGLLF